MKNGLILFNSQGDGFDGQYIQSVTALYKDGGFPFSHLLVLDKKDDLGFSRNVKELKEVLDNLIIVANDDLGFNAKEILAEIFESPLVENDNAVKFASAVCKAESKGYKDEYALIPSDASLIPNISGIQQGFILDSLELSVALLPSNLKELSVMSDKYIIPYLENKYELVNKRITLKYFGDLDKLNAVLKNAKQMDEKDFTYSLKENNGDVKIVLLFTHLESANRSKEIISFIVGELKENIYAEFDTTLEERVFDLLKLRKIKLSVAESFTGGRITSALINNSGISEFLHEGIVSYSNESKMQRLNVDKGSLIKEGAVSSIVAYKMVVGLLKTGNCDLAISTTGIAGPNSDNTSKPVGLCYIAVGMKDGVHTYKYNFKGTREKITETAKNTALFLAIKKLKGI